MVAAGLATLLVIAGVVVLVGAYILHWLLVIAAVVLVGLGIYVLAGGSLGAL
jgi:hypothetical protein